MMTQIRSIWVYVELGHSDGEQVSRCSKSTLPDERQQAELLSLTFTYKDYFEETNFFWNWA